MCTCYQFVAVTVPGDQSGVEASTIVSALLQCASDSSELVRWNVFQSLQGLMRVPAADIADLAPQIVSTLGNTLCSDEVSSAIRPSFIEGLSLSGVTYN